MHDHLAHGNPRLSSWLRVRRFAVPPSMIETATARRAAGDWAGACAAAAVDVDLDLRSTARTYGRDLVTRLRADLRHLAPDLLRWHLPRIAPDGLLRPGLTVSLARYGPDPLHLVVRTPPAWADAGQRISLALWDPSHPEAGAGLHPHPHPSRRFRLDLHQHLWDARRSAELALRSGAADPPDRSPGDAAGRDPAVADVLARLVGGRPCAVGRWAAEAAIVLAAEGRTSGRIGVRYGTRHRLVLDVAGGPDLRITAAFPVGGHGALPLLPDAATWVPPDVELLRAGLLEPGDLHPLVADALVPGRGTAAAPGTGAREGASGPKVVQCRGARHRIDLVDGVLAPLDHGPDEVRREELLAALTGTPLPCLQAIDAAHRRPECLEDVRARLDHGDTAGALAVVESLLGPNALMRHGALRDELETAALRRIDYGVYRAGLSHPAHHRSPRPAAARHHAH